jgi:hypothetical protein
MRVKPAGLPCRHKFNKENYGTRREMPVSVSEPSYDVLYAARVKPQWERLPAARSAKGTI